MLCLGELQERFLSFIKSFAVLCLVSFCSANLSAVREDPHSGPNCRIDRNFAAGLCGRLRQSRREITPGLRPLRKYGGNRGSSSHHPRARRILGPVRLMREGYAGRIPRHLIIGE
jgi:hypothetical protein